MSPAPQALTAEGRTLPGLVNSLSLPPASHRSAQGRTQHARVPSYPRLLTQADGAPASGQSQKASGRLRPQGGDSVDSPDRGSDSAAWLMDGTPTSDLPVALPFFSPGTITNLGCVDSVALGTRKHLIMQETLGQVG